MPEAPNIDVAINVATRLNALESCLREVQAQEWDRLLTAIRRGISPLAPSIEADGIVLSIRRQALLVGPTPWDEVPWEVYVSGLYAAVLRDIPWTPPSKETVNSTALLMERHHNPSLTLRCTSIASHYDQNGFTE